MSSQADTVRIKSRMSVVYHRVLPYLIAELLKIQSGECFISDGFHTQNALPIMIMMEIFGHGVTQDTARQLL